MIIKDLWQCPEKYDVIYADPPWSYSNKSLNGSAEKHYSTMNTKDIGELPVESISKDNCVLFMWMTYPLIKEGLWLMEKWGFKYKTIGFQWIKLNRINKKPFFGLGNWTRGNSEPCFIGVKGKMARNCAGVHQVIMSEIEKHSKKPDEARHRIEQLVGPDCRKIELFATQEYNGWDCWGNEI